MIVSKFIWNFFQEVIANKDNSPTKTSVLMYAYFQMLYNLGTLFESAGIPSSDRVSPLKNAPLIKNYISKSTADLLPTVLYIGHSAFMKKLYPTSTQLSAPDFGINLVPIPTNMTPDISPTRNHI
jgi:hypothetical protein